MQNRKLSDLIRTQVYPFSPHYRARFDRCGIDPNSIRTIDDLQRYPELLTTKADFADNPRDIILQPDEQSVQKYLPRGKKLRLLVRALSAAVSRYDEKRRRDVRVWNTHLETLEQDGVLAQEGALRRFARYLREAMRRELEQEYKPADVIFTTGRSQNSVPFVLSEYDLALMRAHGEKVFELLNIENLSVKDGRIIIENKATGASLFPNVPHLAPLILKEGSRGARTFIAMTGGGKGVGTDRALALIGRQKPRVLFGTPDYMVEFLRKAYDQKLDFASVDRVVVGGDRIMNEQRETIKEILSRMGAKNPVVLATYGFTESRLAFFECYEGALAGLDVGYHIFPDELFIEIVNEIPDPKNPGKTQFVVCKEGEIGEIVGTPLDGRGSVVLRYRIRDYASLTLEPCPACGRTLPRILPPIFRRSQDMEQNIKNTRVDLNDVHDIFRTNPDIAEWQVFVRTGSRGEDLVIAHVAPKEGVDARELSDAIQQKFRAVIEFSCDEILIKSRKEIVESLGLDTELKVSRIRIERK